MSHMQTDTQPAEQVAGHNRLEIAMTALSPISRRVIELWLAGLSRPQIALEAGICAEDVSKIGLRAIREIRDLLAGAGEGS